MARNFNGTSQYVKVDDVARTISWFNDPFGRAFCGWMKAPAGQSNVFMYSEGAVANNTNFWGISIIQASPATNLLRVNGLNFPGLSSVSVVADSTWHHVAFVVYPNPTGTNNWVGLFVDGKLEASQANLTSGFSGATTNEATLGALRRSSGTPGNFYKGLLAHWAIWNRALSSEEVRMLARGALPSRFRPKHYWRLAGPDSAVIRDIGRGAVPSTPVAAPTLSADVPPLVGQPRPRRWDVRFDALAVPSVGITNIVPSSAEIQVLADPPLVPIIPGPAEIQVVADEPAMWPLLVPQASIEIRADPPLLAGPAQPESATIEVRADPPTTAGPLQVSASGVVKIFADAPKLPANLKPPSGQILVKADPPTVIPVGVPSAKITVKGDGATAAPASAPSGRVKIQADPPTVYPVQIPSSARIVIAADADITSQDGIVAKTSGIIEIRSDPPIVTPLKEPPPPPPPPLRGTGISGVIRV